MSQTIFGLLLACPKATGLVPLKTGYTGWLPSITAILVSSIRRSPYPACRIGCQYRENRCTASHASGRVRLVRQLAGSPADRIALLLCCHKREDGALKVTGHAPDEATRAALLAKIEAYAGDKAVEADIQLAEGMPSVDWPHRVSSAIDAFGRLESGRFVVADDDVRLKGDVASMTELVDIKKLAAATPGGDTWRSDLVVLRPTVRPYVISIDKGEDGTWTLAGVAPDEASRDALIVATKLAAKGASVDARLQLADGMPGEDWQAFVEDRLEALGSIKSGTLSFTDHDAKLEGIVATLEDAAEADEQVTAIDTELEALDPTVAAFIDLRLSPDDDITLDGALPPGLSRDEAIKTLGIQGGFQGEQESARLEMQRVFDSEKNA